MLQQHLLSAAFENEGKTILAQPQSRAYSSHKYARVFPRMQEQAPLKCQACATTGRRQVSVECV